MKNIIYSLGRFSVRICLVMMGLVAFFAAKPARASFGDCNSSSYLAEFDPRFTSASGFLCVESDRVPVTSEAGTTNIRIVQHLVADWATRPGAMRSFKDGVSGAVRAMASLGNFRIPDVTILLVDGFGPGHDAEQFGEVAAWTNPRSLDECRITIWLLGAGATASVGGSVVAHELFHCIEGASLGMTTGLGGPGRAWWVEGAADWFSTLALPPADWIMSRVRSFDEGSPTTALNAMSYQAFVFFAWLGGANGPQSVLPFLRVVAPAGEAEGAVQAAMQRALTVDQWLKFAEDYLDRKIHDGQGAPIGSNPQQGSVYEWRETRTQREDLQPYVIKRAALIFNCGRWTLRPQPAKFYAVRPEDGEWGPLPENLDAMSGNRKTFRFAGMATGTSPVNLQIQGTLAARCAECSGGHEIDRCLVGTWQVSVDGMQQWMREHIHKANVTGVSQEGNTLTLNSDGTFATGSSHVTATLEGSGNTQGRGSLNSQATGRWSASGGHLNMCPDNSAMNGTITVIKDGHPINVPFPARTMPPSSRVYSCSGNSFTLTTQIGSVGSVTSTYSKTSAAP